MTTIRNILVIVDPTSKDHAAIDKAALLAQRLDARLELYVCETKASRQARLAAHLGKRSREPLVLNAKALLESLAAPLRARGLDVATETECAEPLHFALVDRTSNTTADLVVKDTHHHSLARRTFLTNTDWELIRRSPVPLLLTKGKPWAEQPRVFAAVDPGHANDKPVALDQYILAQASLLATRLGGELHVVHAYVPVSVIAAAAATAPPMAVTITPEELALEEQTKLEQLREVTAPYGVPLSNIHLEVGGPAELLPRVAERANADVLVMGAIARSGLKRIFIGSTAEDVLEHLPCDALVVKTPGFSELLPV